MWGMIAGAALSVVGGLMNRGQQNSAQAQMEMQRRKQNMEYLRQGNVADANLVLKAQSAFEQTRQEIENVNIQGIKASSSVRTAIGESNLEGRSMDRVQRDVDNVALRTKGMLNTNYKRDYQNIWAERVANRDATISAIKGNAPQVQQQSGLGSALGLVVNATQGMVTGEKLFSILKKS